MMSSASQAGTPCASSRRADLQAEALAPQGVLARNAQPNKDRGADLCSDALADVADNSGARKLMCILPVGGDVA